MKREPIQKRGINTKNKVLKSAIILFSKKGYHYTNTKEIASTANIAIGSLYSYFKNKKEIFIELLKDYKKVILSSFLSTNKLNNLSNFEIIKLLINNIIRNFQKYPYGFHREVMIMKFSDSEINSIYDKYKKIAINNILNFLNNIKEQLKVKNMTEAAIVITNINESFLLNIIKKSIKNKNKVIEEYCLMIYKYLFK